jgi:PII-like signaling protein
MIFLSEDDRIHHHGVHEALLAAARTSGISGASVWRGIEGFGSSRRIRTNRFPDANSGLPLVVELIDSPERMEGFLPTISELAPGSLVTKELIRISRKSANISQ